MVHSGSYVFSVRYLALINQKLILRTYAAEMRDIENRHFRQALIS
jgi:hypothetical protein